MVKLIFLLVIFSPTFFEAYIPVIISNTISTPNAKNKGYKGAKIAEIDNKNSDMCFLIKFIFSYIKLTIPNPPDQSPFLGTTVLFDATYSENNEPLKQRKSFNLLS